VITTGATVCPPAGATPQAVQAIAYSLQPSEYSIKQALFMVADPNNTPTPYHLASTFPTSRPSSLRWKPQALPGDNITTLNKQQIPPVTRLILAADAAVKNTYTYDPVGRSFATQTSETIANPFQFTGQCFDETISQYHLRARQYDPALALFTTRDPVLGKLQQPLSLHAYLYCINDPINRTDPSGRFVGAVLGGGMNAAQVARVATGATIVGAILYDVMHQNMISNAIVDVLIYTTDSSMGLGENFRSALRTLRRQFARNHPEPDS